MKSDSNARILSVEAKDLQLKDGPRDYYRKNTPGKIESDHAGHLIADMFGGSGNYDNLISMNSKVNLVDFKKLELKWRDTIKAKIKVSVKIDIEYINNETRPNKFNITYKIGNETEVQQNIINFEQ